MNNDLISRKALKEELTSETRDMYVFVCLSKVLEKIDNAPTTEQDTLITEIIEELESRKDYGAEYAQAMEDVIVILKAKFGIGGRE